MKTIQLSDFEYEQIIVILENQPAATPILPTGAEVTSKVGKAWIKKLIAKLKTQDPKRAEGKK